MANKIKVKNLTYQSHHLNINNDIHFLKPRGKDGFIIVGEITTQINNLVKRGLLKITYLR